jgi:PAS domain S-box-containing protein
MELESVEDDLFRLAVESSPAAMIVTGQDGAIQFANAETSRMFGYQLRELVGQNIDILVPMRLRPTHLSLRQGFLANPSKRPVIRVHWVDSPKKSTSGVGICAGSLDSLRADSLDRRMQTPGNGRSRVGPIAIEGAKGSPVNDRKKSTDLTRVHRSTAKPKCEKSNA